MICITALFISGKSKVEQHQKMIIKQETLITTNAMLRNEVNILIHEKDGLVDSLAVVDSALKKKDTVYVKVVGPNEVMVSLNGRDIRQLGHEIAKALSLDTTRKVNIQVINKRKGLFR